MCVSVFVTDKEKHAQIFREKVRCARICNYEISIIAYCVRMCMYSEYFPPLSEKNNDNR